MQLVYEIMDTDAPRSTILAPSAPCPKRLPRSSPELTRDMSNKASESGSDVEMIIADEIQVTCEGSQRTPGDVQTSFSSAEIRPVAIPELPTQDTFSYDDLMEENRTLRRRVQELEHDRDNYWYDYKQGLDDDQRDLERRQMKFGLKEVDQRNEAARLRRWEESLLELEKKLGGVGSTNSPEKRPASSTAQVSRDTGEGFAREMERERLACQGSMNKTKDEGNGDK